MKPVCLVLGAGAGIGGNTAHRFASEGYHVALCRRANQEGLDNIHEITQAADIVMVARGDLGIETDLADLPNIQRRIMYASAKWGRRSIVATHLLESMIKNPTPTRAEVTDVANAIYEGADAVMLSGETSVGKYPVRPPFQGVRKLVLAQIF